MKALTTDLEVKFNVKKVEKMKDDFIAYKYYDPSRTPVDKLKALFHKLLYKNDLALNIFRDRGLF